MFSDCLFMRPSKIIVSRVDISWMNLSALFHWNVIIWGVFFLATSCGQHLSKYLVITWWDYTRCLPNQRATVHAFFKSTLLSVVSLGPSSFWGHLPFVVLTSFPSQSHPCVKNWKSENGKWMELAVQLLLATNRCVYRSVAPLWIMIYWRFELIWMNNMLILFSW